MGTIYRPISIRKDAAAQADANRLLARAQLDIDLARAYALAVKDESNKLVLTEASERIEDRTQARVLYQEVHRQENLESIAKAAASHLPEKVSSDSVDEEWKTRFFRIAEDVRSTDMQDLWGKILAGEVATPGTYSVRTLEVLKNLSKKEAETFQKLRYLTLDVGHIIKVSNDGQFKNFGISVNDILGMREAGLLADGDMLQLQLELSDSKPFSVLGYNGKGLLIEKINEGSVRIEMESFVLTTAGNQLFYLIEPEPNIEYLKEVAITHSAKAEFYFGIPGTPRTSFSKISPD